MGDGSVESSVEVPSPLGVAVGPEERVFVISRKRILEISDSGTVRNRVKRNLNAPIRLDVDSGSGDFFVAEGPDDWRVKRFGPDGDLKQTYGRKGGRRSGVYEPEDFRALSDVTADGNGGFYIAENGTVLFFATGRNSVPVYRIHGWDGWERYERTVSVSDVPHADREGEGLFGEYYENVDNDTSDRSPSGTRVDKQVWHGLRGVNRGKGASVDGARGRPRFKWSSGNLSLNNGEQLNSNQGVFVRWSGKIEIPLSEPIRFITYQRGKVRLWIDGRLVIDRWGDEGARKIEETEPISLTAGQRVSVKLEYQAEKQPAGSLLWESPTLERNRIPAQYLYPSKK